MIVPAQAIQQVRPATGTGALIVWLGKGAFQGEVSAWNVVFFTVHVEKKQHRHLGARAVGTSFRPVSA